MILWKDGRTAMRTVFEKTMKKNKPDEIRKLPSEAIVTAVL
jgi:hypothetical protein